MLIDREFTDAAERYLDMVYRIALNWFGSPADAEDAARNAMVRLWRTETDFSDDRHLCRWQARVTINECKRISSHPWRGRTVSLSEYQPPAFTDPAKEAL